RDWFRGGCLWDVGEGKVLDLRPRHETFAVYKERPMLRLVENAARWPAGPGDGPRGRARLGSGVRPAGRVPGAAAARRAPTKTNETSLATTRGSREGGVGGLGGRHPAAGVGYFR